MKHGNMHYILCITLYGLRLFFFNLIVHELMLTYLHNVNIQYSIKLLYGSLEAPTATLQLHV